MSPSDQPDCQPSEVHPTPQQLTLRQAIAHHQLGQLPQAEALYVELLQSHPDHLDALNLLGILAHQQGRYDEAIALMERAIALDPSHAEAIYNLALALQEQGKLTDATAQYQALLRLQPDHLHACNNLANVLRQQGRLEEAIALYQQALQRQPGYAKAHNNLGLALQDQQQLAEAIAQYQQAIQAQPDYAEAYYNLGNALLTQGNLDQAIANYQHAICLQPDYADALLNLGMALHEQGRLEEAIALHQQTLGLNPNSVEAYINAGVTLLEQGKLVEAIASYQQALQRQPNSAAAHLNLAIALLLNGDLSSGFAEYEWRWQGNDRASPSSPSQRFSQPLWDGSPFQGQTLLLQAEQGQGDTIQFIRYLPLVRQQGGRVILECQASLARLLAGLPGLDATICRGEPLPAFDLYAPLLSLPHLLHTRLDTIPATVPYVSVPAGATFLDPPDASRFNIGVVWASGYQPPPQGFRGYVKKSCPRSLFEQLLDIPSVTLYSLQKGRDALDPNQSTHPHLIDLAPHLHDFADTAAAIAQLDLVISVDTAVAHLAGALGKPVWLLVPHIPDWRWLLERADSPWYPTMQIFRQVQPGDWPSVFSQVMSHLRQVLGQSFSDNPPPVSWPNRAAIAPPSLDMAIHHHQAGQWPQAEQHYRAILQTNPDQSEAWHFLGVLLHQTHRSQEGIRCVNQAIALQPNNCEAHYNLGLIYQEQQHWQNAIHHYQMALHLNPDYLEARNNLGNVYEQQNQLTEAIAHYRLTLHRCANFAKAHHNLGFALHQQGQVEEAIASYQRALAEHPTYAEAHYNLSHTLLLTGQWQQGWEEYEWRWQLPELAPQAFPQPLWDGASLANQTILLHAEQGLGDTIQFVRYGAWVKAQGGRVVLQCPPALVRLFQANALADQVIGRGEPLPDFDVHCPLLSLPRLLGTTPASVPHETAYLQAGRFCLTLPAGESKALKVGIVWASGQQAQARFRRIYQKKSCPLSLFLPWLEIPGVCLYSLQVGADGAELETYRHLPNLYDLGAQVQDFADTAAAIAALDLVISVDTAVAHLAGALGKPVWLLLPFIPDWRWLLHRDDTPWYACMRLFRQPQPEDWTTVTQRVAIALQTKVRG